MQVSLVGTLVYPNEARVAHEVMLKKSTHKLSTKENKLNGSKQTCFQTCLCALDGPAKQLLRVADKVLPRERSQRLSSKENKLNGSQFFSAKQLFRVAHEVLLQEISKHS